MSNKLIVRFDESPLDIPSVLIFNNERDIEDYFNNLNMKFKFSNFIEEGVFFCQNKAGIKFTGEIFWGKCC